MAANLDLLIRAHDQASATLSKIEGRVGGLSGALGTGMKYAALGAAAGLGVAVVAGINFMKQAAEEEAGIKRLAQAVDNAGGNWAAHGKDIEAAIAQREKLAFSDDDLRSSLAMLTAQTGSVDEGLRRQTVAMDLARGANIDLGMASKLLGKVTDESHSALSRLGIVVDKNADSQQVMTAVQAKFAGQSAAFADSTAGKWARVGIMWDNLKETMGAKLLPVALIVGTALVSGITAAIPLVETISQVFGDFFSVAKTAFVAFNSGWDVANEGLTENLAALNRLPGPLRAIAIMVGEIAFTFKRDVLPVLKQIGEGIQAAFAWFTKDGDRMKAAAAAVGALVVAMFTAWAISAAAAAAATIAAFAPIVAGVVAIAAIGAALVLLERETGAVSDAGRIAMDVFRATWEVVGPLLAEALVTLKEGWADLQPVLSAIGGVLEAKVLPVLAKVGKFLTDHPILIAALVGAILLIAAPWLAVVAALVVVLAKWDEIKTMLTVTIPGAIDSVIAKVGSIPVIGDIFRDTLNTIRILIETWVGLILIQFQFVLDSIKNAFDFWKAIFSGDWAAAWDAVKAQFDTTVNALSGILGLALDAIKGLVSTKLEMLKGIGSDIGNALANGLEGALVGALNWAIDQINAALRAYNSIPLAPNVDLIGNIGGRPTGTNLGPGERNIGRFALGGLVPGPRGAPRLAVVHGGEEVLTPGQQGGGFDYDRFAAAMVRALSAAGLTVEMDGREVGRLVSGHLGVAAYTRARSG